MPRVLGTAHQVDVDVLTWELVAPQAEKTQAIKKKSVDMTLMIFILVLCLMQVGTKLERRACIFKN